MLTLTWTCQTLMMILIMTLCSQMLSMLWALAYKLLDQCLHNLEKEGLIMVRLRFPSYILVTISFAKCDLFDNNPFTVWGMLLLSTLCIFLHKILSSCLLVTAP